MTRRDHQDVGKDDKRIRGQLRTQAAQQRANAREEEREGRSKQKKPRKQKGIGGGGGGVAVAAAHGTKPFAIMRTEKLKSMVQVTGAKKHNLRLQETPNADPARTPFNKILIGSDDLTADVRAKIGDRKVRKNAVLVIDQVLTASPEFFDKNPDPNHLLPWDPKQINSWVKENLKYIKNQWGDNVVNVVLHLDETSPHLHVYVVPLDYSKDPNGRLSAKAIIGGSKFRLSQMQDEYAKAMAPFGLTRGVKKSKATHQSVRRYYGLIQEMPRTYRISPVHLPALQRPGAMLDPVGFAEEQVRIKAAEMQRYAARLEAENRVLKEDREQDRKRVQAATEWQKKAAQVRDLDLRDVAKALGAVRQKGQSYVLSDVTVAITKQRFHDVHAAKSGTGAVSLAMHMLGCDFKTAVRWLSGRFGQEAAAAAATAQHYRSNLAIARTPQAFVAPPRSPDPSHLEMAVDYFVRDRAIPEPVVRQLIERGDLYAEARVGKNVTLVNAVLVLRDSSGAPVGAELVGIHKRADGSRFKGTTPGTDKGDGGGACGPERPEKIALVDTATDAISYTLLHPTHLAISTAGAASPERFQALRERYMHCFDDHEGRWICAFSNTEHGRRAADALGADTHELSVIRRAVPGDDLRKPLNPDGSRPQLDSWSEKLVMLRDLKANDGGANGTGGREHAHDLGLSKSL